MKIEAIIRPERLAYVRKALEELGYPGMTFSEVKGHGKQKGLTRQWRGQEYKIEFLPKVKLEVVVINDGGLDDIIDAIVINSRTGEIGDGKIFVWPITDAIRIRTGERGRQAV